MFGVRSQNPSRFDLLQVRAGGEMKASGQNWELRLGDYREVMQDVACDCLITDAPYSDRTHAGHFAGSVPDAGADLQWIQREGYDAKRTLRKPIEFAAWSHEDVERFCEFWSPRVSGWFVTITDHVLARSWESALHAQGRYVFAPLPFLELGKQPRLTGDGPASWTCWVVVARPKSRAFASWGSLPGGYATQCKDQNRIAGGKPEAFMRELVRDYSRQGQTVVDPCAGFATTGVATIKEGRRFIGSEIRQEAFDKSVARLSKPFQAGLFVPLPAAEQPPLDLTP